MLGAYYTEGLYPRGSLAALSTFYPAAKDISDAEHRHLQVTRLMAKVPTLAAFAYRHALGLPYNYPDGSQPMPGPGGPAGVRAARLTRVPGRDRWEDRR